MPLICGHKDMGNTINICKHTGGTDRNSGIIYSKAKYTYIIDTHTHNTTQTHNTYVQTKFAHTFNASVGLMQATLSRQYILANKSSI